MSFIRYAGDAGKRIDIGPFDTTGIVDATTITSVIVRVSHRADEAPVDWPATHVNNLSTYSVTATVITDGILNAEPGTYKFRCYFFVDGDVVLMQDSETVLRFLEGPAPSPVLAPPYDGWEARIAAAEQDAAAADAFATSIAGRTYSAVRTVHTSGARDGLVNDGVTHTAGERILSNLTPADATNGIYIAVNGPWTRAPDMASGATIPLGGLVSVLEGTDSNRCVWLLSEPTTGAVVVGTSLLGWTPQGSLEARLSASGDAQILPDADITLTIERRARQVALTTPLTLTTLAVRSHIVPIGTIVSERRVLANDVANSMMRLRFINVDGSHIAWINGLERLEVEWGDDSRWHALSPERRAKVFYPEDFGPNVGVGDASSDTTALLALAAAIYNFDASGQASGEQSCEVLFTAPEYHITQEILFRGTDYTSLRLRGTVPGWAGGFKGNRIQWAGAAAAQMTGTPAMTFNRAARTIVRSAGSWITDGFTTGMRIYCGRPDNQNTGANVRIFDTVTVTNATTLTVTDTGIAGMVPFDEVAATGYQIVEALTAVRFLCSGFEVRDLAVFSQDSELCFGFHVDFRPDVTHQTNTTDFKFIGCAAIGLIDHALAALWFVGRPSSNPAVGSQCDTGRWRDCFGVGSIAYDRDHQGRGIAFGDGSNTKDFWIDDSMFWSCRRAIDHEKSSETIRISGCRFDDVGECCVYNNGFAEVSNCQAERIGAAVLGDSGNLVEHNNSWNMRGAATNIVLAQRQITASGSQYINDRVYMTVTAVDLGTDIWTATNNNEVGRVPSNGDEVVIRAIGGDRGVPGGLDVDATYWLAGVGNVGSTVTFQLYKGGSSGGGGTLVDAVVAPHAVSTYVMSPAVVALNDQDKAGATTDQSGASFDGCRFWGAEKYPHVRGTTASYYTLDAYRGYQAQAATRVHVRNCYGIRPGPNYFALREISSVPQGYSQIAPTIGNFSGRRKDGVYLGQGLKTDGWSTLEFDWRRLKDGSGQTDQYIVLPYRTGIKAVMTEVVADENGLFGFGGGALSAITVQCGYSDTALSVVLDPDDLLTAQNIFSTAFATNQSDRRWGFTDAERGVRLQGGSDFWPKKLGADDYGWVDTPGLTNTLIVMRWTLTGAAFSALTRGRLELHIKLEQIPRWNRA